MTELILQPLAASFIVVAIYAAFWEGMIFDKIGLLRIAEELPDVLQIMVYECLTCMGFWYGLALSFIWQFSIVGNLMFALITMGFCVLWDLIIGKMRYG